MEIFRPGGLELTSKALDLVALQPGDRVLDIGCGLGASLAFIRDKYDAEVLGVDVEPVTVKRAGERLGAANVFFADAGCLPFEDGSFTVVLMECVLTLVPEPGKALMEAMRVLRPGGSLVVSTLTGAEQGELCSEGRLDKTAFISYIQSIGGKVIFCSDESAALRRFLAEIIFFYDSIDDYIRAANCELGGTVLSCNVPMKGTGYMLFVIKK